MLKLHYTLGFTYVAACTMAVAAAGFTITEPAPRVTRPQPAPVRHHDPAPARTGSPFEWFARIKPYCNSVEVETAYPRNPAPAGTQGVGYAAACFALAGKIDRARELLLTAPGGQRYQAAGIVFEVAHPVADAGDDRSAGPIMALVVEFWPNHYMALYHAGASEAALGQTAAARAHLTRFLELYPTKDGWRSSALTTLGKLGKLDHAEAEER